jgi:hypothetical protein
VTALLIALWIADQEVLWCGGYYLEGGSADRSVEHCGESLRMWSAAQPPNDDCRELMIPLLTKNEHGVLVSLNCECWDGEDSVWYAACEKPVQSVEHDGSLQEI